MAVAERLRPVRVSGVVHTHLSRGGAGSSGPAFFVPSWCNGNIAGRHPVDVGSTPTDGSIPIHCWFSSGVEQGFRKAQALGSNPRTSPNTFADIAQR